MISNLNNHVTVRYRSKPFFAVLEFLGRYLECYSFIYEDEFRAGFGIQAQNERSLLCEVFLPCDLVAVWRTAELAARMKFINTELLDKVYFSAFSESIIDHPEIIAEVVQEIGQTAYNEVMYQAVPEEIVSLILEGIGTCRDPESRLKTLTQAVRRGTLEWSDKLKVAGVIHPDVEDAEINRREKIVDRYRSIINKYCKARALAGGKLDREVLEDTLIELVDTQTKINKIKMVALAGFLGDIILLTYADSQGQEISEGKYRDSADESLLWSAEWLYEQCIKSNTVTKSIEEYVDELMDLAALPPDTKDP